MRERDRGGGGGGLWEATVPGWPLAGGGRNSDAGQEAAVRSRCALPFLQRRGVIRGLGRSARSQVTLLADEGWEMTVFI